MLNLLIKFNIDNSLDKSQSYKFNFFFYQQRRK